MASVGLEVLKALNRNEDTDDSFKFKGIVRKFSSVSRHAGLLQRPGRLHGLSQSWLPPLSWPEGEQWVAGPVYLDKYGIGRPERHLSAMRSTVLSQKYRDSVVVRWSPCLLSWVMPDDRRLKGAKFINKGQSTFIKSQLETASRSCTCYYRGLWSRLTWTVFCTLFCRICSGTLREACGKASDEAVSPAWPWRGRNRGRLRLSEPW